MFSFDHFDILFTLPNMSNQSVKSFYYTQLCKILKMKPIQAMQRLNFVFNILLFDFFLWQLCTQGVSDHLNAM